MIAINLAIVRGLVNSLSLMFVITFLMSLTKPFRKTMYGDTPRLISKLLLAVVFGSIGILGTYYGFPVDGAIANSRAVPIVAAGLIAGPIAGIGAGIIAGAHRYAIDIGGFTAFACMISTIVEGVIGASAHKLFVRTGKRWFVGFWATVIAEVMQMSIILWIARPYDLAWALVEKIGAPMIIVNAVGVALFVLLYETIYKDREREAAVQSQLALRIAEKTLPILRQGFTQDTALETCKIILAEAEVDAVAMASCKEILAHVG
ncbi:MAG: LytS/YhcK type 5TM receptor domain-containing protein, partial [Bacillota bacterium]|nr:LytS/YhcK type 5TM receptor domain-containing protein [Bacillota bacterium]